MLSQNTNEVAGNIYINTKVFHPLGLRWVILHEACHLIFNLEHNDSITSIMYHSPTTRYLSSQVVKNINAFLPAEKTKNASIKNNNLNNDMYDYCTIDKKNNSTFHFSNDDKSL